MAEAEGMRKGRPWMPFLEPEPEDAESLPNNPRPSLGVKSTFTSRVLRTNYKPLPSLAGRPLRPNGTNSWRIWKER